MPSSSEPTTPTISSVASSDISFEDAAVIAGAVADPISPDVTGTHALDAPASPALTEHPMLFIREDMVKIQIEDMLFRLPSFYVADSPYFRERLSGITHEQKILITDEDVTAAGFANLIYVLRPYPGSVAVSTLSQWTDVLHLSSKWGFVHARAVAIQAIPPLASPVDKIVLGRTYDLSEWLPEAFTDIIERSQKLTVEDACRLTREDLVAIANGREDARGLTIKPRGQIEAIARSVLGLTSDTSTSMNVGPINSEAPDVAISVVKDEAAVSASAKRRLQEAQIDRWLTQRGDSRSSPAATSCLQSYVALHSWARLHMVAQIVKEGLNIFQLERPAFNVLNGRTRWAVPTKLKHMVELLNEVRQWKDVHGYYGSAQQNTTVCLEVIKNWSGFESLPYDVPSDEIFQHPYFITLIISTKFIDYLVSQYVVESRVFATFWTALCALFADSFTPGHMAFRAQIITHTIDQLNACVSRLAVSVEQDAFYQVVERAASLAEESKRPADAAALQKLVQARNWPNM